MKNFHNLVNSSLTTKSQKYDKLSSFVYELMHLDKLKHNLWVVTKRQELILMTDNPYLGTQLKYQQATICQELNKKFLLELKTSKVKIIPPTAKIQKKKESLYVVGDQASQILKSIASQIEDEELKESLLKLTNQDNP